MDVWLGDYGYDIWERAEVDNCSDSSGVMNVIDILKSLPVAVISSNEAKKEENRGNEKPRVRMSRLEMTPRALELRLIIVATRIMSLEG